MPGEFTIKLGEGQKRVTIEVLTEALENALEVLRNVGQSFTPSDVVVKWEVVAASLRSPLTLSFAPSIQGNVKGRRIIGKRIANISVLGIKALEKRAALPNYFNEEALLATEKLIKGAQREGIKITVSSNGKSTVTPTAQTVENIRQVVEKARIYIDYGTLEGSLEIVSVHGRDSFFIFESFTNNKVECIAPPELFAQSIQLLKKRVAVSGRVRYRNHIPSTIQVEGMRVLRSTDILAQPRDIGPVDITGGLSSEEHVREIRDAR
jgi:hypothetical protein